MFTLLIRRVISNIPRCNFTYFEGGNNELKIANIISIITRVDYNPAGLRGLRMSLR
jgi:hypothetical protein